MWVWYSMWILGWVPGSSRFFAAYVLLASQNPNPSIAICWPIIDNLWHFFVIQGQPFNCKSSMFKSLQTKISHLQNTENVSLHSSNSWQCNPVVVNPVMKMRPHPMAHPYWPVIVKNPPYPSGHEPTFRKNLQQVLCHSEVGVSDNETQRSNLRFLIWDSDFF